MKFIRICRSTYEKPVMDIAYRVPGVAVGLPVDSVPGIGPGGLASGRLPHNIVRQPLARVPLTASARFARH